MAGDKENSASTTVSKSIYDYVDLEKLNNTRKLTQKQLQSRANDFTPFDKSKNNLNLSLLARHAAYNEVLSKELQTQFPEKYAELQKEVGKYTNAQDKNKAAEDFQKRNTSFYIDQRKVFKDDAEYNDYVKVRNYTDNAHGYKSLGTDVYADKYASRMATQDVNPSQSVSSTNFIQTTREADKYNNTHKEQFNTRAKYDLKTKSYDLMFEDQKMQDRLETQPIPNPAGNPVGIKGMQGEKIGEMYKAIEDKKKEQEKIKTSIPAQQILPNVDITKRKGTDNTVSKLHGGGDNTAGYVGAFSAMAGVAAEQMQKNKSNTQSGGPVLQDDVSVGANTAKYAAAGAGLGVSFGGVGAIVGGAVGGIYGAVAGSIRSNKVKAQNEQAKSVWAQEQNNKNFLRMPSTQSPMARKGVDFTAKVEQGEVKVAKVLSSGTSTLTPKFKLTADWTDKRYPKHEEGGEPITTVKGPDKSKGVLGEAVITAKDGQKVKDALRVGDHSTVAKIVDKLPKNLPSTSKATLGVSLVTPRMEYDSNKYSFGKTTFDANKELGKVNALTLNKKPTVTPTTLGATTISKGGKNWWYNSGTTTLPAGSPMGTASVQGKDNSLAFQKALAYAAPVADVIRGMSKDEKTNRRYITAEEMQYSDKSAGLRQEAAIADKVRRGNTTTSAQQNRSNANASSAMKSRDMQNIGANENARADQVVAMTVGIRNQTKQQNLELANRYDEQDLQNKAVRDSYGRAGLRGISDTAQQHMQDAAISKRDLMIAENLLGEKSYAYSAKDGLYFIRNADGSIGTSKTKPVIG